MVAKTLEAQASTGQTGLTVSAYPIGTDTVATQVSAAAATEATNRLGWYTCTADDLAAGDYQVKILSSGGTLVASWMARIAAGAATYQCHESLPHTIPTVTTNTDMRGTDSAALASVATEARLAELDAANLPTDIAAIPTTAMRGTDSAATAIEMAAAKENIDYALTVLVGALSTAGTAGEVYTFTVDGVAYTVTYAGLDSSGNRGTTVLSKV